MKWNSLEWNGLMIWKTSDNVGISTKIDSHALHRLHGKTSFTLLLLLSILSAKFAFSYFLFPSINVLHLNRSSKGISSKCVKYQGLRFNVVETSSWAAEQLHTFWKSRILHHLPNCLCDTSPIHVLITSQWLFCTLSFIGILLCTNIGTSLLFAFYQNIVLFASVYLILSFIVPSFSSL